MQRISLAYYYDMGVKLARIRQIKPNTPLDDVWADLYLAQKSIEELVASPILQGAVRTSFGSACALIDLLNELTAHPYDQGARRISMLELTNVYGTLDDFQTVWRAEFSNADAYYVTAKRGFDTLQLVTKGEVLWPPALWEKVPDTLHDVREAGKCLAFELSTAAGFHIIRVTELVLLNYWKHVTNGEPLPTNRNLGNYLHQLQAKRVGNEKIIAALLQIKDLHRNELFHPEVSLSLDEAIELLGIAQSAVSAMLRELPVVPAQKGTLPPADPLEALEHEPIAEDPNIESIDEAGQKKKARKDSSSRPQEPQT